MGGCAGCMGGMRDSMGYGRAGGCAGGMNMGCGGGGCAGGMNNMGCMMNMGGMNNMGGGCAAGGMMSGGGASTMAVETFIQQNGIDDKAARNLRELNPMEQQQVI